MLPIRTRVGPWSARFSPIRFDVFLTLEGPHFVPLQHSHPHHIRLLSTPLHENSKSCRIMTFQLREMRIFSCQCLPWAQRWCTTLVNLLDPSYAQQASDLNPVPKFISLQRNRYRETDIQKSRVRCYLDWHAVPVTPPCLPNPIRPNSSLPTSPQLPHLRQFRPKSYKSSVSLIQRHLMMNGCLSCQLVEPNFEIETDRPCPW
ncbi:hypothetical protein EV126DRAFT_74214 [Verticillium dahliae]|nr:hypothetical protein EV126DRAFT_74214 [Verticillium dahliae]